MKEIVLGIVVFSLLMVGCADSEKSQEDKVEDFCAMSSDCEKPYVYELDDHKQEQCENSQFECCEQLYRTYAQEPALKRLVNCTLDCSIGGSCNGWSGCVHDCYTAENQLIDY